jgi:hypothetical protein
MIFLAKLGVGVLGTALVGGAALSSEGFVHVAVHDIQRDCKNFTVIVPAALVPLTLRFVPQHHFEEASEDLRSYMPIIDAAITALGRCPDGVFVEVFDPGEHVVISKVGGSIVIDVNDPGETVHVAVPLRAAESAIHEIAAKGRV